MAETSLTPQSASSSPQEQLLLRLIYTADNLHRLFHQRLRPFGLTPTQYNVLRILRAAPDCGLTCTAIGRSTITPVPDITRLLARLQAQKLITQRRDTTDRRVVWTSITQNGLDLLASLDATIDQAPRELFRALTCQQVNELSLLLERVMSGQDYPLATPPASAMAAQVPHDGSMSLPVSAGKHPARTLPRPAE